ncbi:MAG: hypothetical protein WBI07_14905, partial [Mobilitalea sp.]
MNIRMKTVYKILVCFISFIFLLSLAGCSNTDKASVMPMMQNKIDFTPKENKIIVAETRTLDKVLNVNALVSYDDSEELSFKID